MREGMSVMNGMDKMESKRTWTMRIGIGWCWLGCLALACGTGGPDANDPPEAPLADDAMVVTDKPDPAGAAVVGAGSDPALFAPFTKGDWRCAPASAYEDRGFRCEELTLDGEGQGSFLLRHRPAARHVVAAPHGRFDASTETLAANLFTGSSASSEDSSWSTLIAYSFRTGSPSGLAYNVNRPSLLDEDTCQPRPELEKPARVFDAYMERLDELEEGAALDLYVELHGQSEPGLESTIEVATARLSQDQARRVKQILTDELRSAGYSSSDCIVTLEPLDRIRFSAGMAKRCGSLGRVAPAAALHLEMPHRLRRSANLSRTRVFLERALTRIGVELF